VNDPGVFFLSLIVFVFTCGLSYAIPEDSRWGMPVVLVVIAMSLAAMAWGCAGG